MNEQGSNDRILASIMARAVIFVVFIGSGIGLALMLIGSNLGVPVCAGTGILTVIIMLIGAYYVARAKSA